MQKSRDMEKINFCCWWPNSSNISKCWTWKSIVLLPLFHHSSHLFPWSSLFQIHYSAVVLVFYPVCLSKANRIHSLNLLQVETSHASEWWVRWDTRKHPPKFVFMQFSSLVVMVTRAPAFRAPSVDLMEATVRTYYTVSISPWVYGHIVNTPKLFFPTHGGDLSRLLKLFGRKNKIVVFSYGIHCIQHLFLARKVKN